MVLSKLKLTSKTPYQQPREAYDFTKMDKENYAKEFYKLPWNKLFNIDSPVEAWTFFQTQLQTLVSKIVPLKKTCSKAKPWFNAEIKKLCKEKYKADRQRKNQKLQPWKRKEWHLVYKSLKTKVKYTIKHAKIAYHDLQIQHLSKEESRPFWSEVKRLFDYKKNNSCHLLDGNNKKIHDPTEKANLFNEKFSKISNICPKSFQEESKFHEDIQYQTQGFLEQKTSKEWYNGIFTMKEITVAIRHFLNNKAPGHDKIPAEFYKEQPVCWAPVLACLFFLFLITHQNGDSCMSPPFTRKKVAHTTLQTTDRFRFLWF